MSSSYQALIIDPDSQCRMRLKEAINATPLFCRVSAAHAPEEGLALLEREGPMTVVFLSHRLDENDALQFIWQAKKSMNGRDSAFVLLAGAQVDHSMLTAGLMNGTDGMLLEPYSLNTLVEIVKLAEHVKGERQTARLRAALGLLVRELRDQVGRLALMRRQGHAARISFQLFAEMCSVLKELEPDALRLYYELVIKIFEQNRPAQVSGKSSRSSRYHGASSRIHQLVSQQALERVRRAFAA